MRRTGHAFADDHSVAVDGYRYHRGTRGLEDASGASVSGVLHPDLLALIDEDPGRQVDSLLRARYDDHLMGPTSDATAR